MKKKINLFEKFLFFINIIVGIILLLISLIPFLDPEKLPWLNILSLVYPPFLCINLLFFLMWLIKLKPHFLYSALIIGIGYKQIASFFPMNNKEVLKQSDVKLLSYNVKLFNLHKWISSPTIQDEIFDFINKQHATVICIQEHHAIGVNKIKAKYHIRKRHKINELAIYSQYPILNSGSLSFNSNTNNAIFADVRIGKEIIRIYNAHFESFGLKTDQQHYGDEDNKTLLNHFKKVFIKQAEQIKVLKKHIANCPHRSIIAGDFNNTAFSWNYHQILEDRKDAFVEASSGLGPTYNYLLPLRIDFILPQKSMEVGSFTNFDVKLSDHFPIMARIDLNN